MFGGLELQEVRPDYWRELATGLLVIGGLAWLGLRLRGWRRAVPWAIAGLLAVRIALIGNPLSWQLYAQWLSADDVGWRQHDLLEITRNSFKRPDKGIRYLAVGSSQTGAVYGRYAESHPDLGTFVVAAMMPLDFVLYSDAIAHRRPQVVLLYLSEFDIAKKPSPQATLVSPLQGPGLIAIIRRLATLPGGDAFDAAMTEMAFGEVLPELRYRFVFRAFLDKQSRRIAARLGRHESRPPRSAVEDRIQWLREDLAGDYIDFNLAWLEDFLGDMTHRGIHVVMVEGHYHPDVSSPQTSRMRDRVRDELERLASRLDSVTFVPRSELVQFSANDYGDLTHVKPESGDRFVRQLITRLEDPPGR